MYLDLMVSVLRRFPHSRIGGDLVRSGPCADFQPAGFAVGLDLRDWPGIL